MARETRGSAKPPPSPGVKRKRSHSPVKPEPSLKVVLPSPASLGKTLVEPDHDAKRQKITLKLSANGRSSPEKETTPVSPEKAVEGSSTVIESQASPAKTAASPARSQASPAKPAVEPRRTTPLDQELRAALALIIAQMAVKLPPPMNNILTLWLPPDFKQTEENTLGHVLAQDSLTWESLITLLHVFCENLLVPCSYPNPMPPLERFHLPVPPLALHYPPHAIYNFCASLYALMARIQPTNLDASSSTRWALMQTTPQGNVYTSPADPRVEDAAARKLDVGSLLETMAESNSFGNASPITLQSAIASTSRPVRTLNESLVRRASLKMSEWKRKTGGFGSIVKGVTPLVRDTWTPSFAPTYDSSHAVGAGLYSTIDAAYERAWHQRRGHEPAADTGWYGLESNPPETVDEVLAENATLIDELNAWQEYRAQRGSASPLERESLAAEQLFSSLSRLAGSLSPADLKTCGLAHALAEKAIPTSSPSIRGTLDPRRPRAVHENTTNRTQTVRPASQPYRPTSPQAYRPSFTNPVGNTIYGRNTPSYPVRPSGPGPSNLRQSFAPQVFR